MQDERRHFHRIGFPTEAMLSVGADQVPCELVDLSVNGALVVSERLITMTAKQEIKLNIPLNLAGDNITIALEPTRQQGYFYGFRFGSIDIESLSHLRRILELNLGTSEVLDYDFSQLNHQHSD